MIKKIKAKSSNPVPTSSSKKKSKKKSHKGYTGSFFSRKNNLSFVFRSSYEYAYFSKLELNPMVVGYVSEPFFVYYMDVDGMVKRYFPDVMVLYIDGSIEIVEIKPSSMIEDDTVQRKANAVKEYIDTELKGKNAKFVFITEEQIFNSEEEQNRFLLEARRKRNRK